MTRRARRAPGRSAAAAAALVALAALATLAALAALAILVIGTAAPVSAQETAPAPAPESGAGESAQQQAPLPSPLTPRSAGDASPPPAIVVEGGEQVVHPPPDAARVPRFGDPYAAGARTVIPREAFRDTQKTVADVLEEAPGVTVTRSGDELSGTRVSIRGSRSDQVLILLDGVPLTAAADGPAQRRAESRAGLDLAALPLERVESIEIVRGAASSLYGPGAAAGAILIRTRRATEPALSVAATVGSETYREGDVLWTQPLGGPAAEQALTVHINHRRSDGSYVYYDADAEQASRTTPENPCAKALGDGYFERGCNEVSTSTLALDARRGAHGHAGLLLEYLERDGLGGIENPRPYGHEERRRTRLLVEDAIALGSGALSNGALSSGVGPGGPAAPGATGAIGAIGAAGTTSSAAGASAGGQPLLGWRLSWERLDSERNENTQLAGDEALLGGYVDDRYGGELRAEHWLRRHRLNAGIAAEREVLEDRRFRAERDTGSAFGGWQWHPGEGTWEAALRRDELSDLPGETTWRVAASQGLLWGAGLKASHGTGYRPPTLFELYDPGASADSTVANPELRAETSVSTDGGPFYVLGDALYGELLAFQQDYRQQIIAIVAPESPNEFRFENVNRTRSTGYEAALNLRAPAWFTLDAAYTRQEAVILDNDAVDARDNGNRVPGVPDERWTLSFGLRRWEGLAWLQVRHTGKRYVDTANTRFLRPYTVYDAGLTAPLGAGFSVSLEGKNLTGTTYAELDNYPPPGPQAFLTLRWQMGAPASAATPPASSPAGASTPGSATAPRGVAQPVLPGAPTGPSAR